MELNGKLLLLNPDISTLWNHRRRVFIDTKQESTTTMDTLNTILTQELKLTEGAIAKNTKSYYAWFHRKWCIQNLTSLPSQTTASSPDPATTASTESIPSTSSPVTTVFNPQNEILLCNKLLDLDERNFHCWSYRRWFTETYAITIDVELQFTLDRIQKNFSNYSAWHQRSYLLQKKYIHTLIPLSILTEELELLRQAMFTEPDDQSPWFYHRWIIYDVCKHITLTATTPYDEIYQLLMIDCQHLRSLKEIEALSKWPLIALIHTSQLYYQTLHKHSLQTIFEQLSTTIHITNGILSLTEIQSYLTNLETMDELHKDYYEYLRTNV